MQVDNLLFEMSVLLGRVLKAREIAEGMRSAIGTLDLSECECGRPIPGEGPCRWCLDAKGYHYDFDADGEEENGSPEADENGDDEKGGGLLSRLGVKIRVRLGFSEDSGDDEDEDDQTTAPSTPPVAHGHRV